MAKMASSGPLRALFFLCFLTACVQFALSDAMRLKAKKIDCQALAINGFEHNEWANSWFEFWRQNLSCTATTGKKRCYSKRVDHWPELRRFLAGFGLATYKPGDNLAYVKWTAGRWYVSSNAAQPELQVYAQVSSNSRTPPSSSEWEVYNGSAMEKVNVTVQCVDGTLWLRGGDLVTAVGPYLLMLFVLVYIWLIFSTLVYCFFPPKDDQHRDASRNPRDAAVADSNGATHGEMRGKKDE
eukprot:NODE_3881_length_900_cov_27.769683_g3572_i0.p1 GENE.NODE_3881_length_900_cov_27.769683_g3572_i0~~NODE_3881_length_900_cov_27.769683_g3572_i0.p1  ORF type:complete len:258 (+),score=33.69 NODE_3881_length_900_cov_27.769683_g3572_i0:56-775(+)